MLQRNAIHYRQSRRDAYLFGLTLQEIDLILPSRSDDSLFHHPGREPRAGTPTRR